MRKGLASVLIGTSRNVQGVLGAVGAVHGEITQERARHAMTRDYRELVETRIAEVVRGVGSALLEVAGVTLLLWDDDLSVGPCCVPLMCACARARACVCVSVCASVSAYSKAASAYR